MAKQDYSRHQQKIIKNYYANKDNIDLSRLQEAMTQVYLETSDKKRAKIWQKIEKLLKDLDTHPADIEAIIEKQNLEHLGQIIKTLLN